MRAPRQRGAKSPIPSISATGGAPTLASRVRAKPAVRRIETARTAHAHAAWRTSHDARRLSSTQRGYDRRWRKTRDAVLARQPECNVCGRPASEVDHVVPHKGERRGFFNPANLQSLCKPCHSAKTRLGL